MDFLTNLRRATGRHAVHAAIIAAVLCPPSAPAATAESDALEYAVKAAYLTKFGIYVEWPGSAFATQDSPLNLCLVGDDPFGNALDTAAGAQRIDKRAITVRRLKSVARDSVCHIVYIGAVDTVRAAQIVDALRGSPVLTVSDARNGANLATAINFVLRDNRVRFTIDEEAAVQNGLNISSKLLGLALSVKSKPAKETR